MAVPPTDLRVIIPARNTAIARDIDTDDWRRAAAWQKYTDYRWGVGFGKCHGPNNAVHTWNLTYVPPGAGRDSEVFLPPPGKFAKLEDAVLGEHTPRSWPYGPPPAHRWFWLFALGKDRTQLWAKYDEAGDDADVWQVQPGNHPLFPSCVVESLGAWSEFFPRFTAKCDPHPDTPILKSE
jgi:hypothetical protein